MVWFLVVWEGKGLSCSLLILWARSYCVVVVGDFGLRFDGYVVVRFVGTRWRDVES